MAQSAVTSDLAADTQRLPGPDDLVHARHRARAVGHGGHRVCAAHAEQPIHAGFERGGEHRGVRPRARDDHLWHTGRYARGWRSSAATTAGDSGLPARSSPRATSGIDALLDRSRPARRHASPSAPAPSPPADGACRVADGAPHRRGHASGGGLPLVARHLDRPVRPSNSSAYRAARGRRPCARSRRWWRPSSRWRGRGCGWRRQQRVTAFGYWTTMRIMWVPTARSC
jgi:hypothetical protein